MKIIEWNDEYGLRRRRMIRDSDDPDLAAEIGVPLEPPDVRFLDWDKIKADLHNTLMERGILTYRDLQTRGNQQALTSAILAAVRRPVIALFRGIVPPED